MLSINNSWRANNVVSTVCFSVFFIACLPIGSFACGDYYADESRASFLNPYVATPDYAIFYYNTRFLNTEYPHLEGEQRISADQRKNCEEWAQQLGNKVTFTDVAQMLYYTTLDDVYNALEAPNSQLENAFLAALLRKENKAVLDYFVFAKKLEATSQQQNADPWETYSYWYNGRNESKENPYEALLSEARKGVDKSNTPWLRLRYAYQLLLLYRYTNQKAAFHALFDQHFLDPQQSSLYSWALHHKAAMVDDPAYAMYLYAMSLDRCPEKLEYTYLQFNEELLPAALNFAQNDYERACLYIFQAIHNPGRALPTLKTVSSLAPSHHLLPLLLVREVNKLDNWLYTEHVFGVSPLAYPENSDTPSWEASTSSWDAYYLLNRKSDEAYLEQVKKHYQSLLSKDAAPHNLINLLLAHLLNTQKMPGAMTYLKAVKPATPIMALQLHTEELLYLARQTRLDNSATRERVADLLGLLQDAFRHIPQGERDFQALNFVLRNACEEQGDVFHAYLFHNIGSFPIYRNASLNYSDYYKLFQFLDWRANEALIDRVLDFKRKTHKTRFEQYLSQANLPSDNALLDLRGTISFRKNNLAEAYKAFAAVDTTFWQTRYAFNQFLVSSPFELWQGTKEGGFFPSASKAVFVKQLMDLETQAVQNPAKAAENYLRLGIAWFNCTYSQKSWMMFCYGKSINDTPGETGALGHLPNTPELQAVYFEGSRAKAYFDKALAADKNNHEIHTVIDYLFSCEREEKNAANWDYWSGTACRMDDAKEREQCILQTRMSYYQQWKDRYQHTQAYRTILAGCPDMAAYFGE
ncbi:MAG: hypothetical protein R2795_08605 [Saprospiraceae bacterium]